MAGGPGVCAVTPLRFDDGSESPGYRGPNTRGHQGNRSAAAIRDEQSSSFQLGAQLPK